MWLLALIPGIAYASPIVVGVGEATPLGLQGRHARPFISDAGELHVGYGRAGSFRIVPIGGDGLPVLSEDRVLIAGDGRFIDHTFVPCGGGTFLHVASGRTDRPDDTAWATPVGADLQPGTIRTVVQSSETLATNDLAAVCEGPVVGVGLAGAGDPGGPLPPDWFAILHEGFFAGEPIDTLVDVSEASRMTGSSMRWDDAAGALRIFGMQPDLGLVVASYDDTLAPLGVETAWPLIPTDQYPYWPQGLEVAGGGTLLAHMVRGDADGFAQDTGQVAITVLGPDLMPLETWQLTEFIPPDGAMRPDLVLTGPDSAFVTFDVGGRIWSIEVDLDGDALVALGVDEGDDTGAPGDADTADGGADGSGAGRSRGKGVPAEGCATAPVGGGLLLLLLGMSGRRRGRLR